jgi:hypothetical protein
MRRLLALVFVPGVMFLGVDAIASAQSDVIDGLDVQLHSLQWPDVLGHEGTYPNGTVAIAFASVICNTGTAGVDWYAPMQAHHPFLAFMIAREDQGRFEQVSDHSFIKHAFGASNASDCATCSDTSTDKILQVACSDIYDTDDNGDRYLLGPPGELDPWLGEWNPVSSYFDQGDPPVQSPGDSDGVRSLDPAQIAAFDTVKNRLKVSDGDLGSSTAKYWAACDYVIRGEADALRGDSLGSRQIVPTWSGSAWSVTFAGTLGLGSVLERWTGATVNSSANGDDDGRVYVAHVVSGPDGNGNYHYEYAMHNRDNSRGIGSFRLPVRPGAVVSNAGFRDVDADSGNDWTITTRTAEIEWSTSTNPLEWNTIYNFWFDCDTPPAAESVALLTEARAGAGFDSFTLATAAPMGPAVGTRLVSGMAGGDGVIPDFAMCGSLDAGQPVQVTVRYAAPLQFAIAFISDVDTGRLYHGGTIVPWPPDKMITTATDSLGQVLVADLGPGGSFDLFLQLGVVDPSSPAQIELSNALEIVH